MLNESEQFYQIFERQENNLRKEKKRGRLLLCYRSQFIKCPFRSFHFSLLLEKESNSNSKIGSNPSYRQTLQKETMSTLPFLLSVADELDNINSQSYMDDFGLGFHPHRQFYRTPTIQLSLPAGTDWMQQDGRHQQQQQQSSRYRSYRYYGEMPSSLDTSNYPQTTLSSTAEGVDDEGNGEEEYDNDAKEQDRDIENDIRDNNARNKDNRQVAKDEFNSKHANNKTTAQSGVRRSQTFVSALKTKHDLEDSIRNSNAILSVSKKCGKNYYRQNETTPTTTTGGTTGNTATTIAKQLTTIGTGSGKAVTTTTATKLAMATRNATGTPYETGTPSMQAKNQKTSLGMGIRLHSKCLHGNNSSSDESLQNVSSSIEFLTCFLLKKSRAARNSSSSSSDNDGRRS